jgi:glutaredoxin
MDKGVKLLHKHIDKIEKSNNQIIDKAVKRALKLKKTKLSDVSSRNKNIKFLLIHKDTNNFPVTKQRLLKKFNQVHELYPFVTLNFDPNQGNNKKTIFRSINGNRVILIVNWEDYMQHVLSRVPEDSEDVSNLALPRLGLEENFEQINRENWNYIQNKVKEILDSVKDHTTADQTDHKFNLAQNTMLHQVTRNHFNSIAKHLKNRYKFMEIFYTGEHYNYNTVIIRIHWNVYLAEIAKQESKNRQVPLLMDNQIKTLFGRHQETSHKNDYELDKKYDDSSFMYPPTIDKETSKSNQKKHRRKKSHRSPQIHHAKDFEDNSSKEEENANVSPPLYPSSVDYPSTIDTPPAYGVKMQVASVSK